jgi:hypothetical protein
VQSKLETTVVLAIGLLLPLAAPAATKYVSCAQSSKDGRTFVTNATISDESENAEVELYSTMAPCANDHSCETRVYKKTILPSVIRLVEVINGSPGLQMTTTIDINRSNLSIVTHTSFNGVDSEYAGSCTIKVEQAKKLL